MMRKVVNFLLPLFFILFLTLPFIDSYWSLDGTEPVSEKRKLNAKPIFSWSEIEEFPENFESYYKDHFGFRNFIIRTHSNIMYALFNETGNKHVLAGKDDWLYYTDNQLIEDYEGRIPYTTQQLSDFKLELSQKKDWLASQGCHYIFLIAPNKSTIYPEYLPSRIVKISEKNRISQLVDYLKSKSDIHIVDLREPLLEAKDNQLLYHRLDSHWNDFGGLVVSNHLSEVLGGNGFKEIEKLEAEYITLDNAISPSRGTFTSSKNDFSHAKSIAQKQLFKADYLNKYSTLAKISFKNTQVNSTTQALDLVSTRQRSSLKFPSLEIESEGILISIDLAANKKGVIGFFYRTDSTQEMKSLEQAYVPGRKVYYFELNTQEGVEWSILQFGIGEYSIHSVEIQETIPGAYAYNQNERNIGDLAIMAGLEKSIRNEVYGQYLYVNPSFTFYNYELPDSIKFSEAKRKQARSLASVNSQRHYKAVMTGDSFVRASIHLLSPLFGENIFYRIRPNLSDIQEIVNTESPDIFIEERVERLFGNPNPKRH